MRYKVDAHIRVIDNVCSILPISRIVIEVAQFDTQKINNPNISGKEYQEGNKLGFWNVREYVLARDGHKCQYCKGKSKSKSLMSITSNPEKREVIPLLILLPYVKLVIKNTIKVI